MEASGDLIMIRMRLSGGREVAAEARLAAGSIKEVGASAVASNAQTGRATSGIRASMMRTLSSAQKMKSIGRMMTTYVSIPLIAIGAIAVKSSLDFTSSMEQIHTQAGATAQEVDYLRGRVLDFAASGQSTHGPQDLADALFHIESAGFRGARAMQVLRTSEALATTGHAELESTTNALVGAMHSGIKGTEDMTGAVGILNAIVGAGNMRMEDLTSAMGTGLLTNAKQMGVTLPQVGAALATLTRQGQPATASATRLSMAFRMMMSPTDQAKSALESIGLSSDRLGTMMQAGKFPQAVALLHDRLEKLGDTPAGLQKQASVIRDVFGARSSAGINAILQGLGDYGSALDQIEKKGTPKTFEALHKAAQEDPAARLAAAWSQVQASFVRLGDVLVPVVVPILSALAVIVLTLADAFAGLPHPVQIGVVVLMLMMAVIGPLLVMLASLALLLGVTFAEVLIPVAIVAGIIAIGVAFAVLYQKVGFVHNAVDAVWGFVKAHWPLLVAPLMLIIGPLILIATHFRQVRQIAGAVFSWIVGAAKTVGHAVGSAFSGVAGWVKRAFVNVVNAVIDALNWLIGAFNSVFDRSIDPPGPGPAFHGIHLDEIGHIGGAGGGGARLPRGVRGPIGSQLGLAAFAGGPTVLGESGPELWWLPPESNLMPAAPTRRWRGEQPQVRGSQNLRMRQRAGGRDRQPIVLQLDGRVVAETTVTLQDDEDARR